MYSFFKQFLFRQEFKGTVVEITKGAKSTNYLLKLSIFQSFLRTGEQFFSLKILHNCLKNLSEQVMFRVSNASVFYLCAIPRTAHKSRTVAQNFPQLRATELRFETLVLLSYCEKSITFFSQILSSCLNVRNARHLVIRYYNRNDLNKRSTTPGCKV